MNITESELGGWRAGEESPKETGAKRKKSERVDWDREFRRLPVGYTPTLGWGCHSEQTQHAQPQLARTSYHPSLFSAAECMRRPVPCNKQQQGCSNKAPLFGRRVQGARLSSPVHCFCSMRAVGVSFCICSPSFRCSSNWSILFSTASLRHAHLGSYTHHNTQWSNRHIWLNRFQSMTAIQLLLHVCGELGQMVFTDFTEGEERKKITLW